MFHHYHTTSQVLGYRKECTGFSTWKFWSLKRVIFYFNINWHSNVTFWCVYHSFSLVWIEFLKPQHTWVEVWIWTSFSGNMRNWHSFSLTTVKIMSRFSLFCPYPTHKIKKKKVFRLLKYSQTKLREIHLNTKMID